MKDINPSTGLIEIEELRGALEVAETALEKARQERDLAEAKCRWIEGVKTSTNAVELSAKLPPDILMAPMPFPDRLDYAAKMIQSAFERWSKKA